MGNYSSKCLYVFIRNRKESREVSEIERYKNIMSKTFSHHNSEMHRKLREATNAMREFDWHRRQITFKILNLEDAIIELHESEAVRNSTVV